MEQKKRSSFSSRIGFVLAAAGSAVGLGNLWRFPYLAARYGGGIFLLVYLILALTFGFSLMITEIAIGRKTRLSCIGAYKALDKRFGFLGWLAAFVPFIITPYYCVIGGWVMKYLFTFISGNALEAADNGGFFSNFIGYDAGSLSSTIFSFNGPTPWFILFVLATTIVVIFGVEKGIEKASRIMMPILAILAVVIAIYSLTIPGAMQGLKYYILPDFSQFSVSTVLGAMGQMFYSMSLAMGIMITYGSYMQKENLLEHSVTQIEIFDTLFAFVAGLMIIPAVIAFNGGDPSQVNSGPGFDVHHSADGIRLHEVRHHYRRGILPARTVCGADLLHFADGNTGFRADGQGTHEAQDGYHRYYGKLPDHWHAVLPRLWSVGNDYHYRYAVPRLL